MKKKIKKIGLLSPVKRVYIGLLFPAKRVYTNTLHGNQDRPKWKNGALIAGDDY